jgi:N-methylhydantoinase B/oxoprolinase/acetone carboxylase alpha subunit
LFYFVPTRVTQVAANARGIKLVHALIDEYSLDVVLAYMRHVQDAASAGNACVRSV